MSKKLKAAIAGLAFVAGCEVGIALQLVRMIRDYTIKEAASKEDTAGVPAEGAEAETEPEVCTV